MQPGRRFLNGRAALRAAGRKLAAWMLAFLAAPLFFCLGTRATEVTVFAAASLTDALREIGKNYEKPGGDKIIFNFAASSMLARQIEEGAPADVFFSADVAKMDALSAKGLVLKATIKNRLSNSLVIVTEPGNSLKIRSPSDLAGPVIKRIALAEPTTVPAGIYAKELLVKDKLWAAVAPKVVPTDNVRAALAAVESGNVEAGIVFKTDAAISKKVAIAVEIPRQQGPDIRYSVAVVRDSNHVEAATEFVHYLDSDDATKVFQKYGFIVLP